MSRGSRKESKYPFQQDVNFLLSHYFSENEAPSLVIKIGKRMRKAKLEQQVSIGQLTKQLGLKSGEVVVIEDGRLKQGTFPLRAYLSYANYLNLTLQELFIEAAEA